MEYNGGEGGGAEKLEVKENERADNVQGKRDSIAGRMSNPVKSTGILAR